MIIKVRHTIKCLPSEINSAILGTVEKLDSLCFFVRKINFLLNELTIESEKEVDTSFSSARNEYLKELNALYELGLDFEILSRDYSLETGKRFEMSF